MGRLKFIIDDSYLLATEQLNYELDTFLANILVVQLHHRYDQGDGFKDLGGFECVYTFLMDSRPLISTETESNSLPM